MRIFKIILISLFFLQTSCGYKIVNNLDNFRFTIIDHKLTGEKKINNLLDKNFKRFEDNNPRSKSNFIVHANSASNRSIISKNSSGEALSYNLKITIVIEVYENNNLVNKTTFNENTTFDNLNSKFELKQYENILIQDLTEQIIFKINNKLNSIK
tara:strand:+ start:369 stop:833 length:465 start_codon:yes stop_codon:yes gene_type:complete